MKILITGANGYIGKHLSKVLQGNITCLNRQVCDLTHARKADDFFEEKYFDVVIHCAAIGGSRVRVVGEDILASNKNMFVNLVANKDKFDRLIHFGSGAQRTDIGSYGISKRIIADMIEELDNFYNIIIYGLFDENEVSTRFIKSCVNNCINSEPIEIHETRVMDFFHMDDLVDVVNHYMTKDNLQKTIDCSYKVQMSLVDVAEQIKKLCKSDIDINYTPSNSREYIGKNTEYLNNIITGNFVDRLKENVYKLVGNK